MVGTASTPGPYDPLENAKPDEILFTLLARDPDAPPTITYWSNRRRNRAIKAYGHSKREKDKKLLQAELAQCAEADEVAMAMVEWRTDAAAEEGDGRATYNDVAKSAEQLEEAKRAKRIEELRKHLREAAYHLCEARDGLVDLGLAVGSHEALLTQELDHVNRLADDLEPKRERFVTEPGLPLASEAVA